jgi:inorganic pyrophosphatase
MKIHILLITLVLLAACSDKSKGQQEIEPKHLLHDYPAFNTDSTINAIIEIPAGTNEKWQVNKQSGRLEWEKENGKNRVVNYLPYPGNYGIIPHTLLPKDQGGDGDPLDVLLLGPELPTEVPLRIKLLGVLKLLDRGEVDDKLIAVEEGSPMYELNSIEELQTKYQGAAEIVETWFVNYKGPGKMESLGYHGPDSAMVMLKKAVAAYEAH